MSYYIPGDDLTNAIERARARAATGIADSAAHADLVYQSWTARAVVYVHLYAAQHQFMRCEHVRIFAENDGLPPPPDKRAWGLVMQQAKADRIIEAAGFEAAISSNLSPKVRWRSLIFDRVDK